MRAVVTVGLVLAASPALAQEGIYVGVGLGNFDYTEDGAILGPSALDDAVSAWRVYGGFELNEHLAFEVRYSASGQIGESFSGTSTAVGDYSGTIDADFATTSFAAMGLLPRDWGTLVGGLGYFSNEANVDFSLTAECCGTLTDGGTVREGGLMAIVGAEWRFGRFGTGIGLRLEYEWLDLEDASASTIGVGVAYRF